MSYSSYPALRRIDQLCLDELPSGWDLKRLKYLSDVQPSNVDKKSHDGEESVSLCNYTDVYYNDEITRDIDFMTATASLDQIRKFELRSGDTIITKDSEDRNDIAVPSYVPEDLPRVVCGYHLALLRPKDGFVGAYLKRVLDSKYARSEFSTRANGLTRYGLGTYAVKNFQVPLPSEDEQTAIANFLDRETAKIDTLIDKQEQLIKLLEEKRQAVISHAVTKGLSSDVRMKDSGVEWLGEVPEHWSITYLTHLVQDDRRIMYGIVLPGPNVEEGVPIVKGGDVKPDRLRLDMLCRTTHEIESNYVRSRLREGDLVYSIRGTIGDVEIVPAEIEGANLTQDAARIAPKRNVDNRWLKYVMESRAIYCQLEVGSLGAAVQGVNIRDLKKAIVPFPSSAEMVEIANHLDKAVGELNRLSVLGQSQIELLKERRTALISAAVTGKIDVRNAV